MLAAATFGLPAVARTLAPPGLVDGWFGALLMLSVVAVVFAVAAAALRLFDVRRLLRRR